MSSEQAAGSGCCVPDLCSLRHVGCYSKRNSLIPKEKFLSATAAAAAFVNQLCKSAFDARGSCSSWAGVDSQHGKSLWGQALNRHTSYALTFRVAVPSEGADGNCTGTTTFAGPAAWA